MFAYRKDIDGLRALAVLAVVFFHGHIAGFTGGYVGVDIFFVVSGYLIIGIISKDLKAGRFTYMRFYERRIRRLFPALFCMLTVTAAVSYFVLLPLDLEDFGKSALAASLSSSNILFWRQFGYFGDSADYAPLLHTWSLSVEEQFYLIFPPLLAALAARRPSTRWTALWAIAILSFLAAVWGVRAAPQASFYLPHTRAWEFLLGGFLALGLPPAAPRGVFGRLLRETCGLAGLALIGGSFVLFDAETPFPGVMALPPTLGAALVIYAGLGADARTAPLVTRLLSLKPIVFVGLISYSLYLWHWPIWVLANYTPHQNISLVSQAVWLAASFAAAYLSWRFIETPFRRGRAQNGQDSAHARWPALAAGGALMATGVAGGGSLYLMEGAPWRVDPQIAALEAQAAGNSKPGRACHADGVRHMTLQTSCVHGADADPIFAVWADSHGVELAARAGEVAAEYGLSVQQFTLNACPPALGFEADFTPGCRARNDAVFGWLEAHPTVDTVILAAQYGKSAYVEMESAFLDGMQASIDALEAAGKKVVLVYPYPTYERPVPRRLALAARSGADLTRMGVDTKHFVESHANSFAFLDRQPDRLVVGRLYPHKAVCDETLCHLYADGVSLYFDEDHMSDAAVSRAVEELRPIFKARSNCEGADGAVCTQTVAAR
ncbi:MAG: acyltransferase family protein [Pseudomonadota bacterium]